MPSPQYMYCSYIYASQKNTARLLKKIVQKKTKLNCVINWQHNQEQITCAYTVAIYVIKDCLKTFNELAKFTKEHLIEAVRHKLKGCGFDSRWCHRYFSLT